MRPLLILLLTLLTGAPSLRAQPADTLVTEAVTLATFQDARALAADPSGKLYVVDAGQRAVFQLNTNGVVLGTLGGAGTAEGEFDEPTDIDPTNGLVLVVADAGNSRIQRFSRAFLSLETLPVARIERFTPGATARTDNLGREGGVDRADGRPVAVTLSPSGETFAVEAMQHVVLKWDASRRLERAIGGFDAGEGALVEPVALAADARTLYVADRGLAAVLVYDLFGGYIRALAAGRAEQVRGLALAGETLWVVLPYRILVYETRGTLRRVFGVELGEPLVDAVHTPGATYLLTATRLLRMPP